MKGIGGQPHRKSLLQRNVQHQREVAAAGARLQQLREQEEASRQQRPDKVGNTAVPGGGAYSEDAVNRASPARPNGLVAGISDNGIAGQVRDVRLERVPHWFLGGQQVSVLTFRVEAFDATGDQQLLGSVEMRGDRLEGVVRDGDWVRVTGRAKDGTVLGTMIEVVTQTGTVTRSAGLSPLQRAVYIFTGVCLVLIFLMVAAGILGLW